MKVIQLYLFAVLSGLLLAFGWFPNGFAPLVFIGFVPLLIVEEEVFLSSTKYKSLILFFCTSLTFFIWNCLTTWWIKNASLGGAAMAILCNALLMSIVFLIFHKTRKRFNGKYATLIFISFWLAFEFFHFNWDLSWTWLTLGNSLADYPKLIQWYEYSGVFGGSLWILLVNVFVFNLIIKLKVLRLKFRILQLLFLIIAPIILSIVIVHFSKTKEIGKINCVIVQSNIDPYKEKFNSSSSQQLTKMLKLASEKTDNTTDYLLFPETALTEDIWENQMEESEQIKTLKLFLKQFPKLKIIIGASTIKVYQPNEVISTTARKFTNDNSYYDAYNTALQLDSSKTILIYHKSKLVPGVEKMPYPILFKSLENFAIDLGGTTGSLGTQDERTVFSSSDLKSKTAPVICYESIYGEFVSEYINSGAQFISIITNDGWWGDTPGYTQHLKYGTLRAIETRKWIVRSANTGISCFINPYGEIFQATEWWKPAVIKKQIVLNDAKTFYTIHGDYVGRFASIIAVLLILFSFIFKRNLKSKMQNP